MVEAAQSADNKWLVRMDVHMRNSIVCSLSAGVPLVPALDSATINTKAAAQEHCVSTVGPGSVMVHLSALG